MGHILTKHGTTFVMTRTINIHHREWHNAGNTIWWKFVTKQRDVSVRYQNHIVTIGKNILDGRRHRTERVIFRRCITKDKVVSFQGLLESLVWKHLWVL